MYLKYFFALLATCLYSCTFSSKESEDNSGKEYTSAYICPMHCEGSGSDKPGVCPVCGMDYRENPDYKSNNDKYACPMHDEITGEAGDSCSICGMALEKQEYD